MVKNEQIVWEASFDSEDATLRDIMRVTWYLKPIPIGTEVKVVCEDVPLSIPQQDHEDGWNSTLDNLAAFVTKKEDKNK